MRKRSAKFVHSLNSAVEGFTYVIKTQKNMRIHFLLGIFVLGMGIYFNLSRTDLLFLCLSISLVLICEMVNTSLELTVDLVKGGFHPVVKTIKDISAGAVFVSAVNAVATGYIVFSDKLKFRLEDGIHKIKQSSWHITFLTLIIVLFVVLMSKALSKKGTPFRGGMPSGHAAVAFSIWTTISFLTKEGLIIALSFIMASLIARRRVIAKIHTVWEVVIGALLGTLTTGVVFQLLK